MYELLGAQVKIDGGGQCGASTLVGRCRCGVGCWVPGCEDKKGLLCKMFESGLG